MTSDHQRNDVENEQRNGPSCTTPISRVVHSFWHHPSHNWINLLFTLVIAVSTTAYTFVSCGQLDILHGQATKMARQTQMMEAQSLYMGQQTEVALRTLSDSEATSAQAQTNFEAQLSKMQGEVAQMKRFAAASEKSAKASEDSATFEKQNLAAYKALTQKTVQAASSLAGSAKRTADYTFKELEQSAEESQERDRGYVHIIPDEWIDDVTKKRFTVRFRFENKGATPAHVVNYTIHMTPNGAKDNPDLASCNGGNTYILPSESFWIKTEIPSALMPPALYDMVKYKSPLYIPLLTFFVEIRYWTLGKLHYCIGMYQYDNRNMFPQGQAPLDILNEYSD